MSNRRTLIVVSGTALLFGAATSPLLAGAESPNLGTTTTSMAPGGQPTTTSGSDEFALPAGFSYLIDATNRITVAVPDTWSDRRTTPSDVDGALVPAIGAATDLEVWDNSYDAPGVLYAAFPFTADPQPLFDRFDATDGCTATDVVPYADGVFTGSWSQSTGCGTTGQSAWHVIVASPADQAFTATVAVLLTGPQDQQALDVVLETFNVTPSATWPAGAATPTTSTGPTAPPTTITSSTSSSSSTSTAVPPPPVTTVPSSTAPGPTTTAIPSIGVRLVDDTNFLTVTVPADWTDQELDFSRRDDGGERASLVASPNLQQYRDSFEGSGVYMVALPATTELAALLARFDFPNSCTDGGIVPVDDGRFVGERQDWLNCDGTAARVVTIAARPMDSSFTMLLQVRQAIPDDAALNQIVATAGAVPGAEFPEGTAATPLVPNGPVPPELLVAPTIPLTTLTDDDGRLSIAVPSTWTDTATLPNMNDDASDRPRIAAAPVLDEFYTDWAAPGVQVVAYPFTDDPSTLLTNLGFAGRCTDGGVQSFSTAAFTGVMQTWTDCGGTASRDVLLALSPPDQSVTVYVEVQLPDSDDAPLQAVLSSLQVG